MPDKFENKIKRKKIIGCFRNDWAIEKRNNVNNNFVEK